MGRYELGDEIARGGMGRVVEARDTTLGRTVALKEAFGSDADALRRFAREIELTARLEHPAIVPVHDAGVLDNGQPFYVMRKIAGKPLEALVRAADELDARLVLVPHVAAAANAIAHAHERGVVHRDIKPSNILVGDLGETMVIDWGLAKELADPGLATATTVKTPVGGGKLPAAGVTQAGYVFGTPGFMAPEVTRGDPASVASDVYALGATLYYVLARTPPHTAKTDGIVAEAPAPPLATFVRGVPAELAAIAHKAVAPTAGARYASARALADDLTRFLGGQLVAAHHYSRGERARRFVRRNAAAVGVGGAALAALVVVATMAYLRVVEERDRADAERTIAIAQKAEADARRTEASDRADLLALGEARALAATNPTAAVAKAKPLAAKWWREARAIGEAARAAGVAYGFPAAPHTVALAVAGGSAAALGDDQSVRLYDLASRQTRVIGTFAGAEALAFVDPHCAPPGAARSTGAGPCADARLAIAARGAIVVIDLATGAKRSVELPVFMQVATFAAGGDQLAWVDKTGAPWRLALAAGEPDKLGVDESARSVAPAPVGDRVAVAGVAHLMVVRGGTTTTLADGDVRGLSWSADGSTLAALVDDRALEIDCTVAPRVAHEAHVGARSAIAIVASEAGPGGIVGADVDVLGPTGLATVPRDRDGATMRRPLAGYALGVAAARDDVAIAASAHGELAVVADDGDRVVVTPGLPIERFAAAADSPYVVAAVTGRVLAWNLDDVLARRVLQARPASAGLAGANRVVAGTGLVTHWLDLDPASAVPAVTADVPAFVQLAAAPGGNRAVIVDLAHRAHVIGPGGTGALVPAVAVERVAFTDDDHAVLAAADGSVHLVELDGGTDSVLVRRGAPPVAIVATPHDVAVAFADKVVWRHALAGGSAGAADDTLTLATPAAALAFAGDGTLLVAAGLEVHAWRGGPHEAVRARLQRPVVDLMLEAGARDHERVVALCDDGSAYTFGVTGGPLKPALPAGPPARAVARTAGLYVASPQPDELAIYDPLAATSWPLAVATGAATFEQPRMSADGTRVLALVPTGLVTWQLDMPASADATAAWLDRLTNATAPAEPTRLEWR
nr:protein kinase [Kofleriaceae bacterium]